MKNLKALYNKYHNHSIQDDGGYVSEEFKKFAKDVHITLKNECIRIGACVENFSIGHYDVSGFIKKGDKHVYFSYSVPRGEERMNMQSSSYLDGWLYRTAKHDKDYTGGTNNFASTLTLMNGIEKLLA